MLPHVTEHSPLVIYRFLFFASEYCEQMYGGAAGSQCGVH